MQDQLVASATPIEHYVHNDLGFTSIGASARVQLAYCGPDSQCSHRVRINSCYISGFRQPASQQNTHTHTDRAVKQQQFVRNQLNIITGEWLRRQVLEANVSLRLQL